MGKEAACYATFDGSRLRTKAHLDGSGLALRGELRLRVAPSDIRNVMSDGGKLVVGTSAGELILELGAIAEAWAQELRHPKSLIQKFGIRRTHRVFARRIRNADFLADLGRAVDEPPAHALRGAFDCIVAQFDAPGTLAELETLARHLVADGALWIVTPKGKGSPVPEAAVRAAIASAGLVDVKIAAFDATHTATKAVVPLARRHAARPSP